MILWLVLTALVGAGYTSMGLALVGPVQRLRAAVGMPAVSDATTRNRMLISMVVIAPIGALLMVLVIDAR